MPRLLGRFRTTSNDTRGARPAHLSDARPHQPAADDRHMLDQDLLGGSGRGGGGHGAHELPGHERHGAAEQRRTSREDGARGPSTSRVRAGRLRRRRGLVRAPLTGLTNSRSFPEGGARTQAQAKLEASSGCRRNFMF